MTDVCWVCCIISFTIGVIFGMWYWDKKQCKIERED